MTIDVRLRLVEDKDLPIFFEQQRDPDAVRMAAFTHKDPADRNRFNAHWTRIRGDPRVTIRTILAEAVWSVTSRRSSTTCSENRR